MKLFFSSVCRCSRTLCQSGHTSRPSYEPCCWDVYHAAQGLLCPATENRLWSKKHPWRPQWHPSSVPTLSQSVCRLGGLSCWPVASLLYKVSCQCVGAKQEGQKTCRKVFKVNPFTSKSQFLILYAVFCTVLRFSLRNGVEGEQCKVIIFSIGSTNNAWITYKYLAILYDIWTVAYLAL